MINQPSKPTLVQTASGIAFAAFSCLFLLLFQRRFGQAESYRDLFFSYWSQYVCCLLTLWAVWILVVRWRAAALREQSLVNFPVPEPDSFITREDSEALISTLFAAARSCKDEAIAKSTDQLTHYVRHSVDTAVLLANLDSQSARSVKALETEYSSVRMFCWAIPVIGLVGSVLSLSQAIGTFAFYLGAGNHLPEDVRKALAAAESNLASGTYPLLLAVLLTVIVAAMSTTVWQKESRALMKLDEILRAFVLALSQRHTGIAKVEVPPAAMEFQTADVAVRAAMQNLRSQIGAMSPALSDLAAGLLQRSYDGAPKARQASAGD